MDSSETIELLGRLTFTIHARVDAHAAAVGLSPQQARLLGFLRDRTPTLNELAGGLGLDKSSASGLVDRAERRGLVTREKDLTDGRAVRIRLLPEGRALIEEAAVGFEHDVRAMFAVLTPNDAAVWTSLTSRLLSPGDEPSAR